MTRILGQISRWKTALGLGFASDEVAREQFRTLSQQIPILYGIVIINSIFMAAATIAEAGALLSLAFPALVCPAMIFRLVQWRRRSANLNGEMAIGSIRRALRNTVILANVMPFLLAVWALSVMAVVPATHAPYIPLFTILSMIACAYCLLSLPAAAYSIMISGSSYIAIGMFLAGDPMLIAMAGNIILVTILVIYMVSRQYHQVSRIIASRSRIVQQRAHANELAHQDQLTGLPNRRALVEALQCFRKEAPRQSAAIIMIDMNGFKPVNDTYGHAAGDKLLATIGQRLKDAAGRNDLVARLGGDEFAFLLKNPRDVDQAYQKAEAILQAIAQPVMIEEHELRLGAAVGIAIKSEMPEDPLRLLQHADIALYDAKAKNSSAISLFEGRMAARVQRRTMIEQALSDRAQMKGIELHYQPIFGLRSSSLTGFEALARWDHPELGRIVPSEFVEAAERNGLATRLTIHLFRQAIVTAQDWEDDVILSFNLSGSGLGTSGLDRLIPEILEQEKFDPRRLAVEVTETALLGDPAAARAVLSKLQEIGVRIVLDDFGAGYASIGYLREMHFDGIKLDGSLIRDITTRGEVARLAHWRAASVQSRWRQRDSRNGGK